jgi:hypothetical protein
MTNSKFVFMSIGLEINYKNKNLNAIIEVTW